VERIYEVPAGANSDRYLTALSICLGLFVIVVSLMEWGENGAVRAEALFQNAQRLSAFQRKVGQQLAVFPEGKNPSFEEVTILREEYEQIKSECPYNHDPIDDLLFLSQRRTDPNFSRYFGRPTPVWGTAKFSEMRSFLHGLGPYGMFWLIVLALLWATPWTGR
jgi:hypothetical protein